MSKGDRVNRIKSAGKEVVKGVSEKQKQRLNRRFEDSTSGLKEGAGDRIESLAAQVRSLSEKVVSAEEARQMARQLERTADYLRYRRSSDIAADTWSYLRSSPLIWALGALTASVVVYSIVRSRGED